MTEAPRHSPGDLLGRRVRHLRQWHLRLLLLSLGVAAVLHIGILVLNPKFESAAAGESRSPAPLELSLSPPSGIEVDGQPVADPPEWPVVMTNYGQARAAIAQLWPRAYRRAGEGGSVSLRLTLSGDGMVEDVRMVEGTGDLSKDEAFTQLARVLRFRVALGDTPAESVSIVQRIHLSPRQAQLEQVR